MTPTIRREVREVWVVDTANGLTAVHDSLAEACDDLADSECSARWYMSHAAQLHGRRVAARFARLLVRHYRREQDRERLAQASTMVDAAFEQCRTAELKTARDCLRAALADLDT